MALLLDFLLNDFIGDVAQLTQKYSLSPTCGGSRISSPDVEIRVSIVRSLPLQHLEQARSSTVGMKDQECVRTSFTGVL